MFELNYGAVPTSRTDCLARVLDCGDDNRGSISAICEPDLTIDGNSSLASSENYTNCKICGGFANFLCSRDSRAGWFCSFCNAYNELGNIPLSSSYLKHLGTAAVPTHSKFAIIIDLNCEFEENLDALKMLQFGSVQSLALITIEDGSVTIHTDGSHITVDAESSSCISHLKKLDTEWFIAKYGLLVRKIWTDQISFGAKLAELLCQRTRSKKRCRRNTALAIFLAQCLNPSQSIAFVFGPCTVAPGKVISMDRKNHIRQHRNIEEDKDVKYWKPSREFYNKMSKSLKFAPCTVFVASMDQVGIWEMRSCLNNFIQYESFNDRNFIYDWQAYIQGKGCYEITRIVIKTSNKLLLNGIFGPVSSLKDKDTHVSDTPKGFGGSGTFRYKGPSSNLPSILISLSVDTSRSAAEALQEMPDKFSFQMECYYKHLNQEYVSVETKFIPSTTLPGEHLLTQNFHWDIMAGSIMKKISFAVLFQGKFYDYDLRWWTLEIVKLLKSLNAIDVPGIKSLQEVTYFMQRSTLLRKRNTSPDEWIVYHWTILYSPLSHIFKMVRPQVYSTTGLIQNTTDILNYAEPLLVDGGNVLVVRDTSVGDSRVDSLKAAADTIYHDGSRFPKPWYRETKPGASQDRFVIARLGLTAEHSLHSDDLTLDKYMALFKSKSTA